MTALTLLSHHLCPFVQRAAIALLEKNVPFERVMIDLDAKPDWFLKLSPLGKTPLLQVHQEGREDVILFESNVICEYIEDTQPSPRLHPSDPLERARHRAWMEFGSSVLGDIWGVETLTERAAFEAKREALADKFARTEGALGEGPFFAGAQFSLVDAVFGPVFRYFDVFDDIADLGVLAGKPKLQAWRQALAARPSVQDAVDADYPERLRVFLRRHDSYLLRYAA